MEKSQLIKLVAKETGYSISHVSNVLSGKRKNANISKAIIKLQSASLIKKVQTPAVVKGIKFNHQTDDFSEALGVTLTEATFKKGVSFESKRKSIVAEQIFDKVIIARGSNPEKQNAEWPVPGLLYYYQFDYYDGLLTDYIKSLNYPVTLIRGLRDANDLQYEVTQLRYLQDLMPDVKVVNIICDKEYSHISSSALRSLDKIPNTDLKNYLL